MAAPAGTLTYYTTVTLSAPGNTNGDATLLAAAFNGVVFPYVSKSAAVASAASAAVTISWAQSSLTTNGARIADDLIADFVAQQCAALKASLNAPVTGITAMTTISLT